MAAGRKTGGRQAGTPNKITADVKRAILEAAEAAGGKRGIVGYLTLQASENPTAFMSLLGKVLPLTLAGDPEAPILHVIERRIVSRNAGN